MLCHLRSDVDLAASVGGTPIEQQYTDGSWLGGNGQGKQEVEYLSPMSQVSKHLVLSLHHSHISIRR